MAQQGVVVLKQVPSTTSPSPGSGDGVPCICAGYFASAETRASVLGHATRHRGWDPAANVTTILQFSPCTHSCLTQNWFNTGSWFSYQLLLLNHHFQVLRCGTRAAQASGRQHWTSLLAPLWHQHEQYVRTIHTGGHRIESLKCKHFRFEKPTLKSA